MSSDLEAWKAIAALASQLAAHETRHAEQAAKEVARLSSETGKAPLLIERVDFIEEGEDTAHGNSQSRV
jgi:hypothetical protein